MWRTVLGAVRNGVLHPVPCPSWPACCLRRPGWYCPGGRQTPAVAGPGPGPIGPAAGGVTLVFTRVGHHFKGALRIACGQVRGSPAAAWRRHGLGPGPVRTAPGRDDRGRIAARGANVFLFAQRYEVAQDEVTASVAVSTMLALVTMPVVILLTTRFVV